MWVKLKKFGGTSRLVPWKLHLQRWLRVRRYENNLIFSETFKIYKTKSNVNILTEDDRHTPRVLIYASLG